MSPFFAASTSRRSAAIPTPANKRDSAGSVNQIPAVFPDISIPDISIFAISILLSPFLHGEHIELSGAVAKLLQGNTQLVQHGQVQVRHRRSVGITDVTAPFNPACGAT